MLTVFWNSCKMFEDGEIKRIFCFLDKRERNLFVKEEEVVLQLEKDFDFLICSFFFNLGSPWGAKLQKIVEPRKVKFLKLWEIQLD